MNGWIFTVSSITYAIKGQQLLQRYGVSSYITRNQDYMGTKGCGYGLKVKKADPQWVQAVLEQNGIRVKQITPMGSDAT